MNSTGMSDASLGDTSLRDTSLRDTRRFVTFPLGKETFALDSSQVKELVMAGRVYSFPHTTRSLEGVLVRHGAAIPVCDLGPVFGEGAARSLYVIAQCQYAGGVHSVAIPVSGGCELVQGERSEAPESASAELADTEAVTFVAGLLRTGGRTLPLLDLDRVVSHCLQPFVMQSSGIQPSAAVAAASAREAKR